MKAVPGDAKVLDNGQQREQRRREQADDEPVPRHIELLEEVEGAELAGPAPPSWSVADLLLLPTSTPMHDDADQPLLPTHDDKRRRKVSTIADARRAVDQAICLPGGHAEEKRQGFVGWFLCFTNHVLGLG